MATHRIMVDDLETIKWDALTHAYGTASNIPDQIRLLASEDPEEWLGAFGELYACLCHQQCTVYEATAPAVPFLIELCLRPDVHCRARILEMLAHIAFATSYLAAHGDMTFYDDERDTEEFKKSLQDELVWVRDSRRAVWRGVESYIALLDDPKQSVRVSAPYTLGILAKLAGTDMPPEFDAPSVFSRITAALSNRLESEKNEFVLASMLFALACLSERGELALPAIHDQFAKATSPRVRVSAAICLADLKGSVPDSIVEVLSDALLNWRVTDHLFEPDPQMEIKHLPLAVAARKSGAEDLPENFGTGFDPNDVGADEDASFPWIEGWPRFTLVRCICGLDPLHIERVLSALLAAIREDGQYTVGVVSSPILEYVFGGGKVDPANITHSQRTILNEMYLNDEMWDQRSGNLEWAFRKVGLSHNRRDLGKLLAATR